MQDTRVQFQGREDPLEKETVNPLQYSCLENPMDGEVWLGYSPWSLKESDMTVRVHFQPIYFKWK